MASAPRSIFAENAATDSAALIHPTNNFDLLRFVAASLVIFAHSIMIAGAGASFGALARPMAQLGGMGVGIFFIMSGYLITASWQRCPKPWRFLQHRMLRIFPALIVCVCMTVFVIGPLFSTQSAADYFAAPATYRYLLNALLYTGFDGLPGVFIDHPRPALVNGSLWTLPVEFALYVAVLIAGWVGILNRKTVVAAAIILLLLVALNVAAHQNFFHGSIPLDRALKFSVYFFTGSMFYFYQNRIPLSIFIFLFAAAFFVLSALGYIPSIVQFITLPYLVMYVAHTPHLKAGRFAKYGDFSYGMYIYGFVVEQALQPFFRGAPWLAFFAASYTVTILCGITSWHLIEKRALRRKR